MDLTSIRAICFLRGRLQDRGKIEPALSFIHVDSHTAFVTDHPDLFSLFSMDHADVSHERRARPDDPDGACARSAENAAQGTVDSLQNVVDVVLGGNQRGREA